jgi:hypothetical protein
MGVGQRDSVQGTARAPRPHATAALKRGGHIHGIIRNFSQQITITHCRKFSDLRGGQTVDSAAAAVCHLAVMKFSVIWLQSTLHFRGRRFRRDSATSCRSA